MCVYYYSTRAPQPPRHPRAPRGAEAASDWRAPAPAPARHAPSTSTPQARAQQCPARVAVHGGPIRRLALPLHGLRRRAGCAGRPAHLANEVYDGERQHAVGAVHAHQQRVVHHVLQAVRHGTTRHARAKHTRTHPYTGARTQASRPGAHRPHGARGEPSPTSPTRTPTTPPLTPLRCYPAMPQSLPAQAGGSRLGAAAAGQPAARTCSARKRESAHTAASMRERLRASTKMGAVAWLRRRLSSRCTLRRGGREGRAGREGGGRLHG